MLHQSDGYVVAVIVPALFSMDSCKIDLHGIQAGIRLAVDVVERLG